MNIYRAKLYALTIAAAVTAGALAGLAGLAWRWSRP